MDAPRTRRFGIINAIVLVAATAAGLGLTRATAYDPDEVATTRYLRDAAAFGVVSVASCWTVALVALNLTRYRTGRRDLACRPGFSAGVAILIHFCSSAVYYVLAFSTETPGFFPAVSFVTIPEVMLRVFELFAQNVGRSGDLAGIVGAVWTLMALAGCWRAEATWIDRVGRALGIFWILACPLYWLCLWSFPDPITPFSPPWP